MHLVLKAAFILLSLAIANVESGLIGPSPIEGHHRQKRAPEDLQFSLLFSAEQQQDIVNMHNILRRTVNPTASNMREISWNDGLTELASGYTKQCSFNHSTGLSNAEFSSVGENIAKTGHVNPNKTVQDWFDEVVDYTYATKECVTGQKCGHYTQVVWATSYKIGCAYALCNNLLGVGQQGYIIVCHYGEAGNTQTLLPGSVLVDDYPYTTGTSCSACSTGFTCVDQLCAEVATSFHCDAAPTVSNGGSVTPTLPASPGYTGNTVVTASCANGFASTAGANTAECTAANTWTPVSLTCTAFYCDAAPTVSNGGSVTPTLPASPGYLGNTVVTASCASGFESTAGANTAECTAANTWTPTSLTCTAAATCNAPPTLTQATFPTMPSGGYTGTITLTCNSGYQSAAGAATSSLCTATNTWNPTSLECTAFYCDAGPTVSNGGSVTPTLPASPGYLGNTVVTASCASGFASTAGANTAECTAANTWTPASLTCTAAATCNAPPTLTQATFPTMPSGGYTGTTTLTCNSGYQSAAGAATSSLCTATNTWNPTSLECTAFYCDTAPTVSNGGSVTPTLPVSPGYLGNTVVTASCASGFESTAGANTAECTAANTWTPASLTCTATNVHGNGGLMNTLPLLLVFAITVIVFQ